MYCVSNGQEEMAGVTLSAPFPLTRGYERLSLLQFSPPTVNPGGILQVPQQSDWVEQSAARPSTGVRLAPGSPVSPLYLG